MGKPESNPNFKPYGRQMAPTLAGMTAHEQAELGMHERIQCVWPLVLKLCTTHVRKLRKEGITIAVDDLLQEFSLYLVERDGKWNPAKGKYTTFVNILWRNLRQRQTETRGIVPGPHNAWSHLQRLRKKQAENRLAPGADRTLFSLEVIHRANVSYKERP